MATPQARIDILIKATEEGFQHVKKSLQELTKELKAANVSGGFASNMKEIDKSIQGINKSVSSLNKSLEAQNKTFKDGKKPMDEYHRSILEMRNGTTGYMRDVAKMIKVQMRWYGAQALLFTTVSSFTLPYKAIKEGIKFLSGIETSMLSIATSYMLGGQYIDKTTQKALQGHDALSAAQFDAERAVKRLQVANLQTIATLDQLVKAYQETLPVAMSKGFNKKQAEDFSTAMVQAAGAIGLDLNMLAEETRSLITGTINPRTSRIAVVLGLRNQDIRENSKNADQLFNFLMEKLEAYKVAGVEVQNTWKGLMSNTADIAKIAFGQVSEPLFKIVKYELQSILDSIVSINKITGEIEWNKAFLAEINEFKNGIYAILAGIRGIITLMDYMRFKMADFTAGIFKTGQIEKDYSKFKSWFKGLFPEKADWLADMIFPHEYVYKPLFGNKKEKEQEFDKDREKLLDYTMLMQGLKPLNKEETDLYERWKKSEGMPEAAEFYEKYKTRFSNVQKQHYVTMFGGEDKRNYKYYSDLGSGASYEQFEHERRPEGKITGDITARISSLMQVMRDEQRALQSSYTSLLKNVDNDYRIGNQTFASMAQNREQLIRNQMREELHILGVYGSQIKREYESLLTNKDLDLSDIEKNKITEKIKAFDAEMSKSRQLIVNTTNAKIASNNVDKKLYAINLKLAEATRDYNTEQVKVRNQYKDATYFLGKQRDMFKELEKFKDFDIFGFDIAKDRIALNERRASLQEENDLYDSFVKNWNARVDALGKKPDSQKMTALMSEFDTKQLEHIQKLKEINRGYQDATGPSIEEQFKWKAYFGYEAPKDASRQLMEYEKTFEGGIKRGLFNILQYTTNIGKEMSGFMEDTWKAMGSSFSDFFYEAVVSGLDNLEEVFNNFAKSILRSATNMVGNLATSAIFKSLSGSFGFDLGGLFKFHDGGIVGKDGEKVSVSKGALKRDEIIAILQKGETVIPKDKTAFKPMLEFSNLKKLLSNDYAKPISSMSLSFAPRLHSGLKGDEFSAMLQKSEMPITSKATFGTPNVDVAINVENKTGTPLKIKQGDMKFDGKKYVKNIVFELMQTDPGFKGMFGGF